MDQQRSIDWEGDTFYVASKMGLAPLIRFAKYAKMGMDADDMDGLAAMYDLLEQCFYEHSYCRACGSTDTAALAADDPADGAVDERCCPDRRVVASEFDRWMDKATAVRADQDDILAVVGLVIKVLTERPTERPSDSPAGPPTTKPSTAVVSAGTAAARRLQDRHEASGRPDLALAVVRSQEMALAATGS